MQDDGVLGCGAGVPGLPLSGAIGAADEADFGCCRTRGHSRCVPAAQERQTPNAECERERGCARPCGTWLVYSILVIRLTWPFPLRTLLNPAVFEQSSKPRLAKPHHRIGYPTLPRRTKTTTTSTTLPTVTTGRATPPLAYSCPPTNHPQPINVPHASTHQSHYSKLPTPPLQNPNVLHHALPPRPDQAKQPPLHLLNHILNVDLVEQLLPQQQHEHHQRHHCRRLCR